MASIESEEQETVKYDRVIRKWEKGNKKRQEKEGRATSAGGGQKKKMNHGANRYSAQPLC